MMDEIPGLNELCSEHFVNNEIKNVSQNSDSICEQRNSVDKNCFTNLRCRSPSVTSDVLSLGSKNIICSTDKVPKLESLEHVANLKVKVINIESSIAVINDSPEEKEIDSLNESKTLTEECCSKELSSSGSIEKLSGIHHSINISEEKQNSKKLVSFDIPEFIEVFWYPEEPKDKLFVIPQLVKTLNKVLKKTLTEGMNKITVDHSGEADIMAKDSELSLTDTISCDLKMDVEDDQIEASSEANLSCSIANKFLNIKRKQSHIQENDLVHSTLVEKTINRDSIALRKAKQYSSKNYDDRCMDNFSISSTSSETQKESLPSFIKRTVRKQSRILNKPILALKKMTLKKDDRYEIPDLNFVTYRSYDEILKENNFPTQKEYFYISKSVFNDSNDFEIGDFDDDCYYYDVGAQKQPSITSGPLSSIDIPESEY